MSGTSAPNVTTSTLETQRDAADSADNGRDTHTTTSIEVAARCDKIVARFRRGGLSKERASNEIYDALQAEGPSTSSAQRIAAYTTYLDALDAHEELLATAHERGRGGQHRRGGLETDFGEVPIDDEDVEHITRRRKRSPSESSDDEPKLLRKRCPDERLYAWASRTSGRTFGFNPNLEKTRRLILNHARDIKNAKLHLSNTPGIPHFPDSEWTNVLLGKPVNLDVVFSGAYSTAEEGQAVERIGDIELRHGPSKPAKSIRTLGDWILAWQKTNDAISFVFPHRSRELSKYTEYMLSLFGSRRPSSHQRIIELDKAIRKFVGESNDVELCEINEFRHLESSYLETDGTWFEPDSSKGKNRRRSDEICRQFNENRCRRTRCRFRHVCALCEGDHRRPECKEKTKGFA